MYLVDWPADDSAEVEVAKCPSDTALYDGTGSSYPANTSGNMPKTLFLGGNGSSIPEDSQKLNRLQNSSLWENMELSKVP